MTKKNIIYFKYTLFALLLLYSKFSFAQFGELGAITLLLAAFALFAAMLFLVPPLLNFEDVTLLLFLRLVQPWFVLK